MPLLYDQPTSPLRFKVRMLEAEVMETVLYGCVTWSPTAVAHLAILRTARHRLLLRCIESKENLAMGTTRYTLSYAYAYVLTKTSCENVETSVRKRRTLFAGSVARMGNERLPTRSDVWGTGGGKGSLGKARAGLDELSRA